MTKSLSISISGLKMSSLWRIQVNVVMPLVKASRV